MFFLLLCCLYYVAKTRQMDNEMPSYSFLKCYHIIQITVPATISLFRFLFLFMENISNQQVYVYGQISQYWQQILTLINFSVSLMRLCSIH